MNHSRGEGNHTKEKTKNRGIVAYMASFFNPKKKTGQSNLGDDFSYQKEKENKNKQENNPYHKSRSDISNHVPFSSTNEKPEYWQKKSLQSNDLQLDKKHFPLVHHKSDSKEKENIQLKTEKQYYHDRNEKKIKKYVGLKNQGATCYLNSLLQTFFHLPAFRKLIYEIPYDINFKSTKNFGNTQNHSDGFSDFQQHFTYAKQIIDKTNIILNLQVLFAELQKSKNAVSTQGLTNSFGWGQEQIHVQQDIQEFCINLLDNIKSKLKNTPYSKEIDNLFMIFTRTYYQGLNVKFEETYDDHFFVLSVVVKGFSTLSESLRSLLTTQYLKGKNQFQSSIYGKQDVKLFTKFIKFPEVLMIHLKRFEFDPNLNRNVKINSILMFKEKLNISDFLSESDNEQLQYDFEYELHSVLVHYGNIDGGHYYAYIRPSQDPQWYKFNDSLVEPVDKSEAIDNNFGGPDMNSLNFFSKSERPYSAYMLVYVRKSSIDNIFFHVSSSFISEKVKNYMVDEKEKENKIKINIVDEQSLANNALKGRVSFYSSKKYTKPIYVSNSFSSVEFFQSVASQLEIDDTSFKLFMFEDDHLTFEITRNCNQSVIKNLQDDSLLFCSIFRNDFIEQSQTSVIFLYIYTDLLNHPLRYLNKIIIKTNWPIYECLKNKLKQELNMSKPFTTSIFVKNGSTLTYIDDEKTIFEDFESDIYIMDIRESIEIQDIIFERGFLQDDDKKYSNNCINYFDYLKKMPSSSYDYFNEINDLGTIFLTTVLKYDTKIRIKYSNICLFEKFVNFIREVVGAKENQEITIYKSYEVLPISQIENYSKGVFQIILNTKYLIVNISDEAEGNTALLEIIYSYDSINQNYRTPILVRKEMTVKYILNELKNTTNEFKLKDDTFLRLMQMNAETDTYVGGIVRILNDDEYIYNLKNPLRVEPIPEDQLEIPYDELIPVMFDNKNTQKTVNFLLTVLIDEVFADTKKRIQFILKLDDNSMDRMSYFFISNNQKQSLKDNYIISNMNNLNCQIKIIQSIETKSIRDLKIYN